MATLNELLESVTRMVEEYGGETSVASFIITEADVVTYDDDGNDHQAPSAIAVQVLDELEDDPFIHEVLNDKVDTLAACAS